MKHITRSVKDITSFIHMGGDLTREFQSNTRALEGTEAHQFLQSKYKESDDAEVTVFTEYQTDDFKITINGRIDGVLREDNTLIIEEIKSTKMELNRLTISTRNDHLMQGKMYAYMYALKHGVKQISVRLTYIHIEDYETKSFQKRYNMTQLTTFFENTMFQYLEWLRIQEDHLQQRKRSIEGLAFPFSEYREGQYTFMGAIYQTLIKNDIVYSVAPTGIGKTVGALYAGLKTIKTETEKLFYLTAKNAGKEIVVETIKTLQENGLKAKSVVLHSKDTMCLMDTVDCDPEICPYAKGFFDRLYDALKDIFVHKEVYDRTLMKQYGEYHTICPHEFALSISNYSDIIVCDYNYVFDPRVHLIRYFEDDYYQPKIVVDEAHNLIDRSRSMYSASLSKSMIESLKKLTKSIKPSPKYRVNKLLEAMNAFIDENKMVKARFYAQDEVDIPMLERVYSLSQKLDQILTENKKFDKRKQVLDVYFMLTQFQRINEFFNEQYKFIIETNKNDTVFTLSCLDASNFIHEAIENTIHGIAFFSATLIPIDYYVQLISSGHGKSVLIPSPFKQDQLGLYIDSSTSTRYHDRPRSVSPIIDSLYAMMESKTGNYIVFFPSYSYLNMVLEQFDQESYKTLVQTPNMSVSERSEMLQQFSTKRDTSLLAFFVLGGSFSEGIDYIGDMLHGVFIVGVALPQYNPYNEILRAYYDKTYDKGFQYAYTYPGINKIIQAVGRVIRTHSDYGISVLFDDRFAQKEYQILFPEFWSHRTYMHPSKFLQTYLKEFWNKHHNGR